MRFLLSSQCGTLKRHCQSDSGLFLEKTLFQQPLVVSRKTNRFSKQHTWSTSFSSIFLCFVYLLCNTSVLMLCLASASETRVVLNSHLISTKSRSSQR